jgi:hypothetical protein
MRRFLATFWTIGAEHEWAEQNINTEVKQKKNVKFSIWTIGRHT